MTLKKALIVEDDAGLCALFNRMLMANGWDSVATDKVMDALDVVQIHKSFDMVLCDVEVTDGLALDFIRSCCDANLTTIVISANDQYLNDCRDMGVEAFIPKPLGYEDVQQICVDIMALERSDAYVAARFR